jgi:DNA repair protein RecO (recombination protein O)
MQWSDEGIVLGVRRHGEANAIAELLTRAHGRHLGLVRGGAGSRQKPVLQAGNTVSAVWRARLDDHLGNYTVEPMRVRTAAVLTSPHALFGVTHLAALVRLLPERDPHPAIYAALETILDRVDDIAALAPMAARFELQMLSELGFGLDLDSCVATGTAEELTYVSPKSGRAVSREAGEPWRDRLFRLPAFFAGEDIAATDSDIADGFALTGHFLTRHVLEPRGLALAQERAHFIAAITRHFAKAG